MLLLSIVRFWCNGWIEDLCIKPLHYFPFYGFEFVKPLGVYTYALFFICGIAAFCFAIGLWYRIAAVTLFLSFTYIELIDKSTYLNHYYFMSLVLFMMVFLPADRFFSVDAYRDNKLLAACIPRWCIDSIKLMVFILYFYAGIAKLNSDWLLHALPLKIWLPARNDMPVIGSLFNHQWIFYAFSWFGCAYDLSIVFLLWNKKTRLWAYIAVVIFHGLTAILFPIGMFPYVMIVAALIFFSPQVHLNAVNIISRLLKLRPTFNNAVARFNYQPVMQKTLLCLFAIFFVVQFLFPFRYWLYKDELFWTEQGYRFSWRVMLIEKAGYAQFIVKDGATGRAEIVNNSNFLTPLQEKMMSTQPDMILQFAHIIKQHYQGKGFKTPQVYVDSYVALNGRLGKPLIDPAVNLAEQKDSFKPKTWILPLNDEIKGF